MEVVCISKVEDGFFEFLDLVVHLVRLDMRLELGEVVDSAFAVGGGNDIGRVLADVLCDFAPGSLDSLDRVCKSTVLNNTLKELDLAN